MKNYDKNSLTGFVLMFLILLVFNFFFLPTNEEVEKEDNSNPIELQSTQIQQIDESSNTINQEPVYNKINKSDFGIFSESSFAQDQEVILENEKIKLVISNKGGQIKSVVIKEGPNQKKYTTYTGEELEIFNSDSSIFNLNFSTGISINTKDLYFDPISYNTSENQNSVTMRLAVDSIHYVDFNYKINDDYLVDFSINLIGMDEVIPNELNYMNLEWQMKTPQTEKSKTNQDMYTGIYYQFLADQDDIDYLGYTTAEDEEKLSNKLSWVAFQQQFFSSILVSKSGLENASLYSVKDENSKYIKNLSAKFELPYNHNRNEKLDFQFYFGPNHYKQLQSYNYKFEEIIPLGWGIFGWVNKYIIINIFDFLSKFFTNYGLIIFILTVIIKLALSPFTYKAYLSQAKMKVLKPEIDKMTEKHKGKDPMKVQQETMSLYRKAGVNPMGGCLPMLFQFPILIAMFRFFPASIELRSEAFLWADDLSAYDSIYDLPFEIPFYGDHISLFTLLMTISTLLYTRMNSQMASGQMAQMKWMMYLMPIMFLGFFNNYAAGLSYYYFLANMFTFSQQYFMKKFIDEDAILRQLEENKKKPKKKSNFQKKLEEMQKRQEQKLKNKNKR
ncbi:membrane protein insertase YidC [bacterium]|jgi:YidC/Oxa1 family membrane protein insertase|nr:membrane protein insertase YidC [bacterium]